MKCFLRRSRCVWGRDIEMLTLRVADPVGRGFLRSGTESNPRPRELVVRPVRGEEHRTLDAVRRTDGHWLRPWEATLPPDTLEHIPTFSQYMRRADRDHREGTGLIFGVQIDGRFVGQFSVSNVHWGAMSSGMLGYWIVSEWSGRGLGSLVAACIGSRCACAPRMSALWVCAEVSVSSRRACAPASCTSVASGPTISLSSSIPSPCPREASCEVGGGVRRSTERRRSFSSWGLPILGSRVCRSGANGAHVAGVTPVVTSLFTERFESPTRAHRTKRHARNARSL